MNWMISLSDKDLHAPFVIQKDLDYYDDLRRRLTHFVNCLKKVADIESIIIARKYSDKVCESLRDYYQGNISTCHKRIKNLIKGCQNHKLAVATLNESRAFPGQRGSEIQFFMNIPVAEYRQSGKMETANPAFWKPAFRRNRNRCPAGACVRC